MRVSETISGRKHAALNSFISRVGSGCILCSPARANGQGPSGLLILPAGSKRRTAL